jgi:hypothetical protein
LYLSIEKPAQESLFYLNCSIVTSCSLYFKNIRMIYHPIKHFNSNSFGVHLNFLINPSNSFLFHHINFIQFFARTLIVLESLLLQFLFNRNFKQQIRKNSEVKIFFSSFLPFLHTVVLFIILASMIAVYRHNATSAVNKKKWDYVRRRSRCVVGTI